MLQTHGNEKLIKALRLSINDSFEGSFVHCVEFFLPILLYLLYNLVNNDYRDSLLYDYWNILGSKILVKVIFWTVNNGFV